MRNISTSPTLVLLYRLGTLDTNATPLDEQLSRIQTVLESVPLGRENRERRLGKLREGEGNPVLEGYDCIIWVNDAMAALESAGLVDWKERCVGKLLQSFTRKVISKSGLAFNGRCFDVSQLCKACSRHLGPCLSHAFSCPFLLVLLRSLRHNKDLLRLPLKRASKVANSDVTDQISAEARALAGPPDAKSMVGVDFGGIKVVN